MDETPVLIVGSGPAGAATALELVRLNPGWAKNITILDKAGFPRKKICGGGLTPYALKWLDAMFASQWPPAELDIQPVEEARIRYENNAFAYFGDPVLQIVERKYFDNWLLEKVKLAGVNVLQGETVTEASVDEQGAVVSTDNGAWKADLLVGADGANSIIRRSLGLHGFGKMARLLERITRPPEGVPFHKNRRAVFDFTPMSEGLQGYYWDFPTITGGEQMMNRGMFDSAVHTHSGGYSLKKQLQKLLGDSSQEMGNSGSNEGHPIYRFAPGYKPYSHRALLVGDAAGSDPFLGEGIAFALHYGSAAAEAIDTAFKRNTFGMEVYDSVIRRHYVLSQLWTRYKIARLGYGLKNRAALKLIWKAAPLIMGWQAKRNPTTVPLSDKRMYRL